MKDNGSSIIERVELTINEVIAAFRKNPTLFYTENDIVLYFYSQLQKNANYPKEKDKTGKEHFLVHTEYSTPFRCDMHGHECDIKKDNEPTPKGGKYKRGHYDLVVINPEFINNYSYEEIKGQSYERAREAYKQYCAKNKDQYVILYGLEFMYSRDEIKTDQGIKTFADKVLQDARKLEQSQKIDYSKTEEMNKEINSVNFMKRVKMLAFIKGSKNIVCDKIKADLSKRSEIIEIIEGDTKT